MVELELRHTELPLRWEIGKVPQACQDACGGESAGVPPTAQRLPLMPLYSGSVHRQGPPDSESDEAGVTVDVRGQCAPGMSMLIATTAPTSPAPTRPGLRLAWIRPAPACHSARDLDAGPGGHCH